MSHFLKCKLNSAFMWDFVTKQGKLLQKWSSSLHNDSQNHPQERRKHNRPDQIWRPCSLFLSPVGVWGIMISFVETIHWFMNSDHITASTRNSTKGTSGTLVSTQLISSTQECFLHTAHSIQKFLVNNKTPIVAQQPYSPDLSSRLGPTSMSERYFERT